MLVLYEPVWNLWRWLVLLGSGKDLTRFASELYLRRFSNSLIFDSLQSGRWILSEDSQYLLRPRTLTWLGEKEEYYWIPYHGGYLGVGNNFLKPWNHFLHRLGNVSKKAASSEEACVFYTFSGIGILALLHEIEAIASSQNMYVSLLYAISLYVFKFIKVLLGLTSLGLSWLIVE